MLERWMPAPSYLCMGASESLLRRTTIFDLQDIGGAFIYVKNASTEQTVAVLPHAERVS